MATIRRGCGWGSFGLLWLACGLAVTGMVPVQAQTTYAETVLYNFAGQPPKGGRSYAGVIRDPAGNLYGTTDNGGTTGQGVVYKVDTALRKAMLYSFTGGADGGSPYAGVIRDPAGNLYGTTLYGGTASAGVVYKLDSAGQETVLHSFTGYPTDGQYPDAGVILDSAGNLYGTTRGGGNGGHCVTGCGVVYKLDTAGQETVLYSFTGLGGDGNTPYAGVIRDSAGNLYGTTYYGGVANLGSVYKLDTAGHEMVLCSFKFDSTGYNPFAGVIRDSLGNLYGTTFNGGNGGGPGYGAVYMIDTSGQEIVLYSFTGGADGAHPYAGVMLDSSGNLDGTTQSGGKNSGGVVFKLTPVGKTGLHTAK